jgi:NADH-quinone oxidoreductase subunit M
MILLLLILILMAGGIIAWIAGKRNPLYSRVISLVTVIADFIIVSSLFFRSGDIGSSGWMMEFSAAWVQRFGIGIHLALDGLSLLMLILTFL